LRKPRVAKEARRETDRTQDADGRPSQVLRDPHGTDLRLAAHHAADGDLHRPHDALEAAAAAGRKSVDLADDLYRNGLTSFLDVLDAERELYAAELDLAASEVASTLEVVSLYKALGGGWESEG